MTFQMTAPVNFSFQSDPKNLKSIRKQVLKVAEEAGFDEHLQMRIALAVDEAITNVIRHSYQSAPDKEIQITLSNDKDALRISLRDFGAKPDLSKLRSRDLKDIRPGGLGCYFIQEIMDEVHYDINAHAVGTELKLTKYKKGTL